MTQNLERAAQASWAEEPEQPRQKRDVTQRTRWPWYRSPWVIALAVLVVFNLLYALPRYLSLDPSLSRSPLDPGFQLHYAVVVLHAVTGNVAMVAVFLQVLPWLRQRFLSVHKVSGTLYVFAGVLPSSLLALVLLPHSIAPTGRVGLFAMAVGWIATTIAGYRAQRQQRYRDHRKWMIYSLAFALGTSWGRVIGIGMQTIPGFKIDLMIFLEMASWLWVLNVLVAHWWLQRTAKRRPRKPLVRTA